MYMQQQQVYDIIVITSWIKMFFLNIPIIQIYFDLELTGKRITSIPENIYFSVWLCSVLLLLTDNI